MRLRFGARAGRRCCLAGPGRLAPHVRAARGRRRVGDAGRPFPKRQLLGLRPGTFARSVPIKRDDDVSTSLVHKLACSGLTVAGSMQAAAGQRACALAPAASAPRSFRGTTLPVPCRRAAARCARVVHASAALKPGAVGVAAGVAAATLATAQARLSVP